MRRKRGVMFRVSKWAVVVLIFLWVRSWWRVTVVEYGAAYWQLAGVEIVPSQVVVRARHSRVAEDAPRGWYVAVVGSGDYVDPEPGHGMFWWRVWPRWEWEGGGNGDWYGTVWVPMWMICGLVGLPMAVEVGRWARSRRWVARGRCGECGYDLRGGGGRCPECGWSGAGEGAQPAS